MRAKSPMEQSVEEYLRGKIEISNINKFTKYKNSVIPIKRVNNDKGGVVNQKSAKFSPGISTKDKNKMLRIAAGVVEFMAETIIDYFKDPDMYAELISDSCGVHVHSDLQRMIVKNKGIHRVVLITDSVFKEGYPAFDYIVTTYCGNEDGLNFYTETLEIPYDKKRTPRNSGQFLLTEISYSDIRDTGAPLVISTELKYSAFIKK